MKTFDVLIIGAGTSGLTARREVAKKTDNYRLIDDGPLGTTCARVGCMPSKVLIQAANDFHRRSQLSTMGIHGGENLTVDRDQTMVHVRSLRDRFVRSVLNPMSGWEDHYIKGRAQFVDANTLEVNGETLRADKIIVAAGSRPVIPKPWLDFRSHLVTTDEFFELEKLPQSMAVIGLGVIGIELGQALNRLGVDVSGITTGKEIGGLTDPALQDYVVDSFKKEMKLYFGGAEILGINDKGLLEIKAEGQILQVEKALISVGRRPNVDRVALENAGVRLNERGLPEVDSSTMRLKEAPHIFLPGDVNGDRPILHEAADEGLIAGHNAVFEDQCFKRRVSLGITFSDPNIATVGLRYQQLKDQGYDFVQGEVSFEGQGRSIVKLKEKGLLHVYADANDGKLLGAEIFAPDGEHLAHLLAWALSVDLTLTEALRMPFYHPVIEEGLRTALRDAAQKIKGSQDRELFRCDDPPIR